MNLSKSRILFAAVAVFVSFNLRAEVVEIGSADALAAAIAGDPSGDYKLTANIDCSSWTTCDFSGTLDGDGKTISGLTTALFGTVSGTAVVRDITFSGCSNNDESSTDTAGLVANLVNGTDASFTASGLHFVSCSLLRNGGSVGMIAGKAEVFDLSASDCTVAASCSMKGSSNVNIGGLFGSVTVTGLGATAAFERCETAPAVTFGNATHYFGGIVCNASCKGTGGAEAQFAFLSFTDCTNRTSITAAKSNSSFGGIVYNASCGSSSQMGAISFLRCVNYGSFTSTGGVTTSANIGGIAATASNARMTFDSCVNYGSLSSTSTSDTRICIGGIVGGMGNPIKQTARIVNCANLGDLNGYYVGGIIGSIAHNKSYASNKWFVNSCLQRGELVCRAAGAVPGEAVGRVGSASIAFPLVDCSGSLFQSDTLIGSYAEGASITTLAVADAVYADVSEGLVNGDDLAALNAYNDNCNLWKQGTLTPILKIMPDEEDPDVITVTFVDAADFGSVTLKTAVIARGGSAQAPTDPYHDGYTFIGWDPETFEDLNEDTTVVAVYQAGVLEYTVRFFDWDGSQIGTDQTVAYGEAAAAPADPVRKDYVFTGWDKEFAEVFENLDVHATYVEKNIDVGSAESFASLSEARFPEVVYHLTADIALPSDWTPIDFIAQFDGGGHTIRNTSGKPVFDHLDGTFANTVVDGMNEESGEATTVSLANGTDFGFVALVVSGGTVSGVTLRNCVVKTGDNANVGLIAAVMRDGAVLDGVMTDGSCTLMHKKCSGAGGLVGRFSRTEAFAPKDDGGADVKGVTICAVLNSTNAAPIVTYGQGSSRVGGILGTTEIANSAYQFSLVVSNCVNLADFTSTVTSTDAGNFGGIVGGRSSNDSGDIGILYITDCENRGDINPSGTVANYGGIIGYTYRGSRTICRRCVNRGTIGGLTDCTGAPLTGGSAGGIFGILSELYAGNPHFAYDCANYGKVIGGLYAGGIFGRAGGNNGHSYSFGAINCANYGAVSTVADGGTEGEVLAAFTSVMGAGYCTVVVSNCFTRTTAVYGSIVEQTNPTHIKDQIGGNISAADDGYVAKIATKALNAWAADNDYETWIQGRIGDEVYPELAIFCTKPATSGIMLLIR